MNINYIVGDATQPVGERPKIIVHVCNDIGGWGRGFVTAISKRWPEPEKRYRAWHGGEPRRSGRQAFFSLGRLSGRRKVLNCSGRTTVVSTRSTEPALS